MWHDREATRSASADQREADGFSLVELLIVIVILGIVSSVVTLAVRGLTDSADESICDSNERALGSAIELYMADNNTSTVPGVDAASRMDVIVDAGLLRSATTTHEINADGTVTGLGKCA